MKPGTWHPLLLAALLACGPVVLAGESAPAQGGRIELDTPRAGWRSAGGAGANFSQPVHYPAVAVSSAADQSDAARIRGRIDAAADKGPALLVVNGLAMPLRVEADGSFDRPYLFGAGSNGVEIRDGARSTVRRVQFHAAGAGQPAARLRVLLAWDSDGTDLDLHVVSPDGQHAWYGNRVVPNGGTLDVDVTSGYGPEIYATPTPLAGTWQVYVNYYGGSQDDSGDGSGALTVASLTIVSNEGTVDEKRQTVQVPMRAAGELTLVKSFSYP